MNVKTNTTESKRARNARRAEEMRVEQAVGETTAGLLDDETRKRLRRFGARSGFSFSGPAGGSGGSRGGSPNNRGAIGNAAYSAGGFGSTGSGGQGV